MASADNAVDAESGRCTSMYSYFYFNTLLDDVRAVGVRTRLEVPCEAPLQFKLRQTVHRIKYT